MPFTQAQLDELFATMLTGNQTETFGTRSITRYALRDALQLAALMNRSISGTTQSFRVATFEKGV